MTWWWKPETGAYEETDLKAAGLLPRFKHKAEAEEWLSLFYEDLQEKGVAEVSLREGTRRVYGPMSLDA